MTLRPTVFDSNVAALQKTGLTEPLAKCFDQVRIRFSRTAMEEANQWHRWLLRSRREWPRDRRAAEKGDDLTPLHVLPQAQKTAS
jgi:hypothetical protein